MPGLKDTIREISRQILTDDTHFWRSMTYFFELWVPPASNNFGTREFFFPLVLNPQSISLEEPFAIEESMGQGGGLIVEENGIVYRVLRIRGNTGFKPKKLAAQPGSLLAVPAEKRSHTRNLSPFVFSTLSGQRHFQYLQDAVFRVYADLKRDPESAEKTRMFFHNPKDEEHWEVKPRKFGLERTAEKSTIYSYDIELLVVGPASNADAEMTEQQPLLNWMKNIQNIANTGFQMMRGGFNDLINLSAEIRSYASNFETIMSSAIGIVDAASDFISGTTAIIEQPFQSIDNLLGEIDDAFGEIERKSEQLAAAGLLLVDTDTDVVENVLCDSVTKALQDIATGAAILGLQPSSFQQSLSSRLNDLKAQQSINRTATSEEIEAAGNENAPSRLQDVENRGTELMPGDADRARGEIDIDETAPSYTGIQEVIVQRGDTLMSLAARYLGDARKWTDIAVLNDLKPPYVSGQAAADLLIGDDPALPSSIGVGKKIMVPNYKRPPESRPKLPVVGASPDATAEERILGKDIKLAMGANGRFDFEANEAGNDFKTVSGVDNLKQALGQRLSIQRGHDVLFKQLGIERTVGMKFTAVGQEETRFRIARAVSADPRIVSVRQANVETGSADAVTVDLFAMILGFTEPATLQVEV